MADRRTSAGAAAEAAARRSYGKLVAFLASRTRDVAGAEDAVSEAFAAALSDWPASGVPRNPEGWLLAVARRKMADVFRHRRVIDESAGQLRLLAEEIEAAAAEPADFPDHRLALMFACAHPAIDPAIRAPLILQTVLGFDAATIASAFLVAPAAMAQRLVRAKTRILQAGIPFRVPGRDEIGERLGPVLDAIYAAFAEGWSDPAGTETRRRNLSEEGIWLGRLVASLLPEQPEALGLLALMLHAEARRATRRGPDGAYVPLSEQEPAAWDGALIEEAETLLRRAAAGNVIGRFQLEAAIQSVHAARRVTGRTDWPAIERLYAGLAEMTGSPVVAINRAIALAEIEGAAAGLAALDHLRDEAKLATYQPYWAARADLLGRTGAHDQARSAYRQAIGLEADPQVRAFLQARSDRLGV